MMNFASGVSFFDPQVIVDRTAGLRCSVQLGDIAYSDVTYNAPSPPPNQPVASAELPPWALVIMIVFAVLFLVVLIAACVMASRERQGNPIFVSMKDVNKGAAGTETSRA